MLGGFRSGGGGLLSEGLIFYTPRCKASAYSWTLSYRAYCTASLVTAMFESRDNIWCTFTVGSILSTLTRPVDAFLYFHFLRILSGS